MRVKITLNKESLEQAKAMRRMRGMEIPENFEGPDFFGVSEHGTDQSNCFYGVQLKDGISYLYPISSIARIAEYPNE